MKLDLSGTTFDEQLEFMEVCCKLPMYRFVKRDYLEEKRIERNTRVCGKKRIEK